MTNPFERAKAAAMDREAFERAQEIEALQAKANGGDLAAAHRLREINSAAHLARPREDRLIGLTTTEAEEYKRDWIATYGFWSHSAKLEFLKDFFVIEEETAMPIPTSPTSHAELLAERAKSKAQVFFSRAATAAVKVVQAATTKTDEEKKKTTFFT